MLTSFSRVRLKLMPRWQPHSPKSEAKHIRCEHFLLTNTYTTGTTLRVDGGFALT